MSTVSQVIYKYHKLIPFPWTIRKIKKAGYQPTELLIKVGQDLNACDDADTDSATELIRLMHNLELM